MIKIQELKIIKLEINNTIFVSKKLKTQRTVKLKQKSN